jgi:hypothetical protein
MSGTHHADGGGPAGRTIPLRTSIVLRGTGYGFFAGLTSGALAGAALGLSAPPWLVLVAASGGGIVGGGAGLVAGFVGGVAFALATPYLARHPAAARPAGAAVLPGTFILAWIVIAILRTDIAEHLLLGRAPIATFGVLSAVGAVAGAIVAPRVLHGKRPAAGDDPPGGEGADSLR